ncbi:MAG: GumC family protein, partial [Desulfofundulus sp.]
MSGPCRLCPTGAVLPSGWDSRAEVPCRPAPRGQIKYREGGESLVWGPAWLDIKTVKFFEPGLKVEEEISLREMIEVLLRGKVTIAIITGVAVLVAGVLSFFVLPPTYEATATVMVNQASQQPAQEQGTPEFLATLTRLPQMTIATYAAQVKNPVILRKVLEDLKLSEQYTIAQFAAKINVSTPKDTNLMEIKVEDKDPKLAADIANAVATELVNFVSNMNQQRVSLSARMLKNQIAAEDQTIAQGAEELKNFLKEPDSVTELQADLDAKLKLLTDLKAQTASARIELASAEAGLREAEKSLAQTPPVIKTTKALADDAYLSQVAAEKSGKSPAALGGLKMESEEPNQAYMALQQDVAARRARVAELRNQIAAAEASISSLEKDVRDIQVKLVDKQLKYEQLQQKVDTARQNYKLYNSKYAEALSASSLAAGEANLMLLSQAYIPRRPVAP